MQVVANLVDGTLLGLDEVASGGREGVLFEEEADLIPRRQEVVVAHVGAGPVGSAGGKLGEWMGGEVEVGEEGVSFGEEGLDGGWGKGGGDDEVAVAVEGGELAGGEASCGMGGYGHGEGNGSSLYVWTM